MKHKRFLAMLLLLAAVPAGVALMAGCGKTAVASKQAVISFHSFDGGGPAYDMKIDDPDIVSCEKTHAYNDPKHAEQDGSAYTVTFTLTGKKPGVTHAIITEHSPIESTDTLYRYQITVADDLSVTTVKESEQASRDSALSSTAQLMVAVNDKTYPAEVEDNAAVTALIDKLSPAELSVEAADRDGVEKRAPLPWTITGDPAEGEAHAGDLLLYPDNEIALCTRTHKGTFTKLAHLNAPEDWTKSVGTDNIGLTLWTEWSE